MRKMCAPALAVALSGLIVQVLGCGGDNGSGGVEPSWSAATGAGTSTGSAGSGGAGGQGCGQAVEVCDAIDNNCDGLVDEGCSCIVGATDPCYTGPIGTEGVGLCKAGERTCGDTGVWGDCIGEVTPFAEKCNTFDDDCDGQADDNIPDVQCGFGACQVTVAACNNGQPNPCVPGLPALEVCDGIDNDCDAFTDEHFPGKDASCDTGMLGPCAPGMQKCVMGTVLCLYNVAPVPEVCDDVDNDCSGAADDNIPGTGNACSTGIPGVCAPGIISCKNGVVDCYSITPPSPEVCDNIDNDCDGQADQGNPGGGAACSTGLGGVCDAGTMTCTSGMVQCEPDLGSMIDTCNGKDDDCDGQIDENNPGGGLVCTTGMPGVCQTGTTACENGSLLCKPNTPPSSEICDGLDNDCNGSVDDGNPGGGASCSTGLLGACAAGTMTCVNGIVICKQNVQAQPEICGNGVDDDCNGTGDPSVTVYLLEGFADSMSGWTLDQEWQIGPAMASTGHSAGFPDPSKDNSPSTDNGVAGVVIGGNATKIAHPSYYLTSPVINTAGMPSVQLEFYRWLNSDFTPYMQNSIEVFDGTSWQQIWVSGGQPAISDSSWKKISHNISAYAGSTMQVRFGFSIGQISGLDIVSSWNIDDVQILSGPCQ